MKNLKFLLLLAIFINSCDRIKTDEVTIASRSTLKASVIGGTGIFTVLSYNVAGLPQILSSASNRQYCSGIIGTKISNYDIVNMQEDFNYHSYIYATDTHPYRTA